MKRELELKEFTVWQQYTPTKCVGVEIRDGEEVKIYEPAVFLRGTILAVDGSDAIAKAKATHLASRPMVKRVE